MILIASMARAQDYPTNGGAWAHKARFEELTGHPALIMHYSAVTPELVKSYPIRAMFITGFGYGWQNVPPGETYGINDVLHEVDIPVLGACGGHQLIGWLFNRDVRKLKAFKDEPMRKLQPGEPDLNPGYHPGYFTEIGVHEIEIVKRDPIFKGLKKRFKVPEAHYCEVKRLPKDFVHLARNDNCELQCFRHETKPIYGSQFHAETWRPEYADGKMFITNFFRIAGLAT